MLKTYLISSFVSLIMLVFPLIFFRERIERFVENTSKKSIMKKLKFFLKYSVIAFVPIYRSITIFVLLFMVFCSDDTVAKIKSAKK